MPDHFSAVADAYAEYRPTYPPGLAVFLASVAPTRALAWDCGTGSGQAAALLAGEFEQVIATDLSAKQLSHAEQAANVRYREGDEGSSGLADASCDLVTVAQAAHWFDLPKFYAEVDRVLKPNGVLAIWGYGRIIVHPEIDPIIQWFQHQRVGRYWPPGREHANAQYRTLDFPYPRIDAPSFVMEHRWPRQHFVGYLRTCSAVDRCVRAEGCDPIPDIEARLDAVWPEDEVRLIQWPIHMLIGRARSKREDSNARR
jgi:SAM-dependent methyltransferase